MSRLGRLVEHDPRSRAFNLAMRVPTIPIHAVVWRRYGAAFDQGNLGSCTGNALAGLLNTVPFHKTGAPMMREADAVKLYAAATAIDGFPGTYPPDDTGSSGLAVCKAAKAAGLISGYRWAFGIDQALQALMQGPVITGIDWHEGFDHPDPVTGLVKLTGNVRGGHEIEVNGYSPKTGLVRAWNSWGKWGPFSGRFYFTAADWAELLDAQGDVTQPIV